jgi:hypothetical protein
MKKLGIKDELTDFLLYTSPKGEVKVEVILNNETVWLAQKSIAQLYGVGRTVITKHLKNIFQSGELDEVSVCAKIAHTADDGKKYDTQFYNLDAIISVGYRVNSAQATRFRIWATNTLKEFIIKGFALNDDRFKSGSSMNYFNELQERIREIRISERFFYQKIKDIYTTSIDYEPKDERTIEFFKVVQNKLLWAISQQTAAELVYRRVDATLPLMGMQSYDKKGTTAIKKSDASIAKNYLNEDEIKLLGLLVEQYLAFAETMAQQQTPMYMKDWAQRLDAILQLNGRELLSHAGLISHEMALDKSNEEFQKYKQVQKTIESEQSLREIEEDIKKLKRPEK